ncbi:MAG TPA: HAMP domain-containing sensor histidine kinase [Streptosporangiaceae bacterium]
MTAPPGSPRRSLRRRLALLYGGLFFASGAGLLAVALLGAGSLQHATPAPGAGSAASRAIGVAGHPAGPGLGQLIPYSAAGLAVLAALSVPLGWAVAGRALRPFWAIVAAAQRISASSLHERLSPASPYDEFRELGATLDGLFGRLEASFAWQRHFVANASHELRTPLTVERTLLQVALADPDAPAPELRAACEKVLRLGEQQERLIDGLLTLASSERGIERWEPFDLAQVAGQAVADRRPEAGRRGLQVSASLAPAAAAGDPSLAASLVANLADNALRHNLAGGWVEVATATGAGVATVAVRNSGPVIPPGEVGRLVRPFERLGHPRVRRADGHGLGLAIVCAIARAHGASVTATARPAGGLDIEVSFPARGAGQSTHER